MIALHTLLMLLVQLSNCASDVCSRSIEDELPVRPVAITVRHVYDVVPSSDDEFLVVGRSLDSVGVLNLIHVGRYGEEAVASSPAYVPSGAGTIVRASGDQWWFSRHGDEGVHASVFFVEKREGVRQSRVKVERRTDVWIPLDGPSARGLLIADSEVESALVVDEVTPAGVTRLATLPRRPFRQSPSHGNWSAHVLPDRRIVLISADDPPDDAIMRIRLIGGGDPIELELPCTLRVDSTLESAVDESGRLAIVARSEGGEIHSAFLDSVDEPRLARCGVISAEGDVAARLPFANPSIVYAADRFVAAWVSEDGTIRACELTSSGTAGTIVDVAHDVELSSRLMHVMHGDGEQVRFVWNDQNGEVIMRTMPGRLSSLAIFEMFRRWLCRGCDSGAAALE